MGEPTEPPVLERLRRQRVTAGQTWAEFARDLLLRTAVIIAGVAAVALLLWLALRP